MSIKALAKTRRAVIYARVSKDKSKEIRSIKEQIEDGKRVIAAHPDWELGPIIAEDEAISASRYSTKERPGFRELLQTLQEGDVLVVWAGNRHSRKLEDWLELRKLCMKLGVLLCAGGQVLDLSNKNDRFSANINAVIAERDSDEIADNVRRALSANVEQGKPHAPPPFGYRIIRDLDGRKAPRMENGRLMYWEFHPVEAPLLQEFARRVLEGETPASLQREFHRRGVRGKLGGTMQPGAWRELLISPTSAGWRVHKGKVVGPGGWPAVISQEGHDRLVAMLTDPTRLSHRGNEPVHLLSGVARCSVPGCNGPMKSITAHKRKYYACRRRRDGFMPEVDHPSRETCLADAVVLKVMRSLLSDRERCAAIAERLYSGNGEWKAALAEARRKEAYLQEYIDAATDPDAGITPLALARMEAKLRPEIKRLYEKASATRSLAEPGNSAGKLFTADDSLALWESMPMQDKKDVLNSIFRITILSVGRGFRPTEKHIRIEWKDDEEKLAQPV